VSDDPDEYRILKLRAAWPARQPVLFSFAFSRPEKGRFAPIVLKKSFFAMTENSQDRWCVSLAAM
jgi:hypothetical protein